MQKILIALDSSSCSERAGRVGLAFAKALGSQVVATHVLKPTEDLTQAQRVLEPWVAIAQQMGLSLQTKPLQAEGVAEGIVELAQEIRADLIVMGTHGREGLPRLMLGSVAERVSRLAPMPVMLVRGNGEVEPHAGLFERILAPIDGSQAGRQAFALADWLAQRLGAELQVLHVVPSLPTPVGEPWAGPGAIPIYSWEEARKALEAEGQAILEGARRLARAPRLTTHLRKAQGRREAAVIVEFAREQHSDLIVMGTHGRTGLERWLLGSVAEGVAHHAPVPLLLVRPTPA
ncbi:universal stress protein [Meiothermus sp. QL-1]|uniref:universal stress protein n=1 Tax=Meiothermus sp. QL-1 TaxID=2058095 RepID=UPI000E0C5B28|nr:universal stress protein [Meiothermus sp. QL-1]RDI95409.1 universal stress protein [Meiothermus sp. QL-1]